MRTNFYTQLPLNEDDNNFDEQLNDINYKRTIRKSHDAGWENSYFISADVAMLDYGCGVSQYTQFYDKYLDMYQVLPRPYRGSFEGFPGDKFVKNGCSNWHIKQIFFCECIETRITSDGIEKNSRKILVKFEKNLTSRKKSYHQHA